MVPLPISRYPLAPEAKDFKGPCPMVPNKQDSRMIQTWKPLDKCAVKQKNSQLYIPLCHVALQFSINIRTYRKDR